MVELMEVGEANVAHYIGRAGLELIEDVPNAQLERGPGIGIAMEGEHLLT